MEGESSITFSHDITTFQNIMPNIIEDISLTKKDDETNKPSLIKSAFYMEEQYKESHRNHKGFAKLLSSLSTSPQKSFSKTHAHKPITIEEKIAEIYLKSQETEKIVEDMNFLRIDLLKELVLKEDLKYITVEMLPQGKLYFLIDKVRKPVVIEEVLRHAIKSKTLSVSLFTAIHNMLAECSTDIESIMVDYHIILNIRNYISTAVDAEPVFSSFILLKPNNMLLKKLIEEYEDNEDNETCPMALDLENLRKESKVLSDISGSLYLDPSPMAKQYINYLKELQYQLYSESPEEKPEHWYLDLRSLYEKMTALHSEMLRHNTCVNSPFGLPLKIPGKSVDCNLSWRKQMEKFLEYRKIIRLSKDPLTNPLNKYILAEIFAVRFIYSKDDDGPNERYVSVFHHHDGSFKFCETTRLCTSFLPRYPDVLLKKESNKVSLDSSLLEVFSLLHQTSASGLCIEYSNLITKDVVYLNTSCQDIIQEKKSEPTRPCCYQNSGLPDIRENYLNAVACDRFSDDTLQTAYMDRFFKEDSRSELKRPYMVDVLSKTNAQEYENKKEETYFTANCVVENGNTRTAFEAHPFEKSHRYSYKTHNKNGEKIKYQFYPSLLDEYHCSEEDFMFTPTLTEDTKKILALCANGEYKDKLF